MNGFSLLEFSGGAARFSDWPAGFYYRPPRGDYSGCYRSRNQDSAGIMMRAKVGAIIASDS
jgi:hypothetical protein